MFKSLSSRSTRPTSSQSGSSSTYTQNTSSSSSSTYTPLPALPPIPPSPERDTIPAIRLVSATPGKSPQSSPLLEKRRTRTLVPRRSVRGKENQPQSETSFTGSLETSTLPPVVDSMHVTGLVARQFAAHHDRQFHSVGPSTGLSLPLASQEHSSSSSAKGSLKVKSGLKHKRVLVESRAYPDGGQVEVVKDTIGRRSSKPALLESVRGTITGTVKGGTVRGENEENAGAGTAGLVVKKKKSRGTLDSIRWALGDRTNAAARKAEKEGQTEEKERKKATSVAERPKATRPTINTHIPREVPLETPITSAVLSPMSATTTGTMTGVTTDSESAAASGTEKTGKWRWTIGKRRAKSPGPSLSSTFDRPAHVRSNSLDPNALMASLHPDESEEAAYTNLSPRASSLELPPLSYTAAAEEAAQNLCSPISSSRPMPVEASSRPISIATSSRPTPVETAPVDFGFQPATVRKVSTGSVESGATRKSSIGSLLSGDNASNTGSFAIRAMRSVRSMASLARIGGWVKGDEDETEKVEKKEKKTGTVKEKKKRRLRKKVIVEEEDATNTSGESWEAGELNRDPTVTVTVPIGKPIIGRQNVYVRHERADLGVRRISEGDEDWPRAGRRSSSGSSFAAPSTISSGSYQQSRMSRASSDAHTVRSRQDSVPAAPNVPANPSIIFEHQEEAPAVAEIPASADGPSATYLGDNAWVGVGADTLKGRTQGAELGRRARKPVIGLFDIPTAEESQSKAPESPPHVEVRGTKIGKGCVRERVRAFEARVEENAGSSATFSASTGRKVSLPILPNATLGRAAVSEVNDQQLSFIQEREYTLSSKRCVSVPLPRPSTSPERPTRSRPWSEQMLRADDEAAIDILNAANSDLSDLISRLDLSATPDTKLASPEARRIPAWVEDSPSRRPRGEQQILTGLLGYNHPSLAKPVQKLLLAEPDDLFTPRALQLPPRATKASGGVSAKSSNDSGRTRIESRHHTGMNTTFGEDSIVEGDDTNADISDELQVLLLGGVETEQPLPSPGMPPNVPLPQPIEGVEIPRVVIEDTTETQLNVVLGSEYSEADEEMERGSRKSFDFTEELGQLKGGSRNSFVEVLVTAFNPPGTDIDEQLQLNVDSLNRLSGATERGSSVVAQEPTAHDAATEAEISFSRAEALAKLTRKSSDQLKLDFQFGPTRETAPQEDSVGTALADSTFALALANLSQAGGDKGTVKRRDATIRFKLDTDSQDMRGEPRASSNSTSSLGNLFHPTTSDPFGFNPSQSANTSRANRHSLLSVPSVYRMPNIPQDDPFDYESLMRELDEASAMVDDPNHGLARRRRSKRMSVDSDRSSFYCRTNAPPVTFHNRGFGRHLGQSLENGSLGVNASRLSWGRHYPEESADSDGYDRPGLGDKMFQTGVEHGMPLPSIMASPTNSEVSTGPQFYYEQHTGKYSYVSDHRRNSYLSERRESYAPSMVEQRRMSFASYDSLVDGAGDERRYSIDMESLYERRRSNSISSISVFGDDHRRRRHNRGGAQPGNFRPVSIVSMQSDISARDDDTMVSMIGGTGEARVRRKSVGSTLLLDASPCFRAEKRAKQRSDASRLEASSSMSLFSPSQSEYQEVFSSDSILESSPSKGKGRSHVTPRPFARPRPPAAMKPVADDYDLEEMDVSVGTPQTFAPYTRPLTVSCRKSRPMGNMTMSVARNRSSALICTAEPPDTPPLSIAGSDASSISGGSQGSIDVSRLMGMLGNTSENPTPSGRRTRARGQGHRRLSRSSMAISFTAEDLPCSTSYSYSAFGNSQANDSVMIVDPEAHIAELAEMIEAGIQLSDEQMASVTRYIALRNEAFETVERSQMIWQDTDFSRFALSTFTPPTYQSEIKALIKHSQDTYATLPVEFYKRHHPRYSRSPRISPYPTDVTRSVKSVRARPANVEQVLSHLPPGYTPARPTRTAQESPMVKNMGTTIVHSSSPAPALTSPTPLSPLTVNLDLKASAVKEKGSKHSLRRTALGWGKRKAVVDAVSPVPPASKTQTTQSSAATVAKENLGIGMLASPSQQTLRVNRPRPKGRSSTSTLRTALRI